MSAAATAATRRTRVGDPTGPRRTPGGRHGGGCGAAAVVSAARHGAGKLPAAQRPAGADTAAIVLCQQTPPADTGSDHGLSADPDR